MADQMLFKHLRNVGASKELQPSYPDLSGPPPPSLPFATENAPSAPRDGATADQTRYTNACARCDEPVSLAKSAYVVLSCDHFMHVVCLLGNAHSVLNTEAGALGGHRFCTQCVRERAAHGTLQTYIDRDLIVKQLRTRHQAATNVWFPDDMVHARLELDNKKIDAILGRGSRSWLSAHNDYDAIRAYTQDEALEALHTHGRTFVAIFDNDKTGLNIYDLYRFGVQSYAQLQSLGFNPVLHTGTGWRDVSPLWLVHELYHISDAELFQQSTADKLLLSKPRAEELWLCGVTMADLVKHGMDKAALLAWPASPSLLVKYLGMDLAALHRLGVGPDDFKRTKKWRDDQRHELVAPLYSELCTLQRSNK